MKAAILGMGEWWPETVRGNDAWPPDFAARASASADRELADVTAGSRDDVCDRIVARCVATDAGDPFLGTTHRRVADESMTSWEAEALAARAALSDAGVDARDVDFVSSWTFVPDQVAQLSAPRVAHAIGASRAVGLGTDVACASTIVQLTLAAALVESGRARVVLITQSHLGTRAFPFGHPASPNVGDAATAMVVGASEQPGILPMYGVSHGEFHDAVVWRRAKGDDAPWYRPGGSMYLGSYDSASARRLVQDTVRLGAETVTEAARRAGVELASVKVLATVQPRRWVPGAIAEALGLSPEIAPQTFDELAHLGACGIVTNLLEARRRGMLRPPSGGGGALVAMYGQGMGFTRAALIVRSPR
jgi:3-oxoacyl-[acyl-carrier-protein] synthase III